MLTTLADKLNDHIKERNDAGHLNFVQQLVKGVADRCAALDITRDDINNEARKTRPKKPKKVSISPSSSKQAPSSLPIHRRSDASSTNASGDNPATSRGRKRPTSSDEDEMSEDD